MMILHFSKAFHLPLWEEYDGTYCRGVLSDEMFEGKEYTLTSSFLQKVLLRMIR